MARTKEVGQGNWVRIRRRELELTQAAVAADVGVSRQTIVSVEAGDYAPSVYLALRLARLFGTSVETLFGEAQPPNSTHQSSQCQY